MTTAYTLGTRTFSKASLTGAAKQVAVPAVYYKGAHWNDVPAGEDGQALVDSLNAQEAKAVEYRAQFTDPVADAG
jgi:hypothetical protein